MSCNSCSNVTLPGVVGPAGAAGAAGADGDSVVVLKIYIRASSPPSTPSGGSYDFSTHTLTAPASWSSGVPVGSDPCYVSNGTASVNGTTGTDSSITWSSPVLAFQNGADGLNGVSILHYDVSQGSFSISAIGNTNQTTATIKRSFSIPANTWQNAGDMVEVELMMIGEPYDDALQRHNVYLELDGNPIEIDTFNTTFSNPGYAGCHAFDGPLIHLKTQLILTDVGTKNIIPITDFESRSGVYSNLSSDTYINSKSNHNFNHRGASTNPSTALDAVMNLKVSATSANASVSVNMFYAKITKYKKS